MRTDILKINISLFLLKNHDICLNTVLCFCHLSSSSHLRSTAVVREKQGVCPVWRGSGFFLGGEEWVPLHRNHCRHKCDTDSLGVPRLSFLLFLFPIIFMFNKHTWSLLVCLDFSIKKRLHVQVFEKNYNKLNRMLVGFKIQKIIMEIEHCHPPPHT